MPSQSNELLDEIRKAHLRVQEADRAYLAAKRALENTEEHGDLADARLERKYAKMDLLELLKQTEQLPLPVDWANAKVTSE